MPHEYPFSDLSELNYSKERRVLNEQLFLDMNKRIKESTKKLLDQANTPTEGIMLRMACECSDASCLRKIMLDIDTFDKIHQVEGQFVITPGHEQRDIEEVVAEYPEYIVVKKFSKEKVNA